jgi:hypothetical protein
MKLTSLSAVALAAFGILAACSPKGASTAAGGSPSPATGAPASGPDVPVDLAHMPRQRAGLWKLVIDNGDGKPGTSTLCLSGRAPAVPKMPAGCGPFSIKRTFMGAYVIDMSCTTPAYSMVTHQVATGDFQTHVSGDSTMTMSGKQIPARTVKMHTDETWVGPCAPGQTPG